jgi:hypothetical protein
MIYQTVMSFDEGKYAHLVLIDGNIRKQLTSAHELDQVKIFPKAERLELLAHLKNLISVANHRDAIATGFMPPLIRVFENGELDVDDGFYESVMSPYYREIFAQDFRSQVKNYERWFVGYEGHDNQENEETLDRLEQPFREEFGFGIEQFVNVVSQLRQLAFLSRSIFSAFTSVLE